MTREAGGFREAKPRQRHERGYDITQTMIPHLDREALLAEVDRLRSFVQEVANLNPERPYGTIMGEWDGCAFCMESLSESLGIKPHKPDCLWLRAKALIGEAPHGQGEPAAVSKEQP